MNVNKQKGAREDVLVGLGREKNEITGERRREGPCGSQVPILHTPFGEAVGQLSARLYPTQETDPTHLPFVPIQRDLQCLFS